MAQPSHSSARAVLRFGSGLKVLYQYGSHCLISNVMRLTCNSATMRVGQGVCNSLCGLTDPRDGPTVNHQRLNRGFGYALFGQREGVHEGGIVDERRCKCLLSCPERRLSHGSHEFGRHPHSLGQEEFDHVASAPLTQQLSKLFLIVLRQGRTTVIDEVWGLPHRELLHFGREPASCCLHAQDTRARRTIDNPCPSSLGMEGIGIFGFPPDRLGGRNPTMPR